MLEMIGGIIAAIWNIIGFIFLAGFGICMMFVSIAAIYAMVVVWLFKESEKK